MPLLKKRLTQKQFGMTEKEKDQDGQFDFRLIVSRSQKIKLTCYCKSKGKRKRADYPAASPQGKKSRPYTGKAQVKKRRKKQIPNPPKSGGFGMTNLRLGGRGGGRAFSDGKKERKQRKEREQEKFGRSV